MFRGLLGSGFLCCGPANAGNFCISVSPFFFCTFVCFCFSFKLNANKFAFFVPRPARHFYAHLPAAIALSAELWGKKCHLLWALVPSIWFTFISFHFVWFHFVSFGLVFRGRKVFQFPNPHKMSKFYSRK